MDTQQIILFSITGGVSCLVLALYYAYFHDRAPLHRLSAFSARDARSEDDDRYSRAPLFSLLVPKVAQALKPRNRIEQQQLKLKMAHAGFNSDYAVEVYLSLKMICLVAGGFLGGAAGCAWFGFQQPSLLSMGLGACLAFYLPNCALAWIIARRQEQILLALPNAIDLLIIAIEVGQGLDAAMRRVAEELERSAPALSQELALFNLQLQMGRSRAEALHDLGMRCGVPEMNSVAAVLIQADRFGASIANTMRQLSESARRKRRQAAEERAQKTAVKLIFPLVLFIFPGIFVVLVGPAAILLLRDLASMN